MSGSKTLEIIAFLVLMILIGNVSAVQQITICDITINDNGSGSVILMLDTAPQGLSGFTIDLSVADPEIAEIYSVTYPSGFGLTDTSPVPFTEGHISGVDLKDTYVPEKSDSVLLAAVGVRGISQGTTTLHGLVRTLDDTHGGDYQPNTSVKEGTITVDALSTLTTVKVVSDPSQTTNVAIDSKLSDSIQIFPKTEDERKQFVNDLKEQGYSSKEIAEKIIQLIRSANVTELDPGYHADTKGPVMSAEEMNRLSLELEILEIHQTIKNASPNYLLLILTDETKPNFLSDIDTSDNDPATKKFLRDSLQQIWKKYPVKYITIGNRTTVTFDLKEQNITLTQDEEKILGIISLIHFEKLAASLESTPKWNGEPGHGDFIYWAIIQNVLPEHPLYNYNNTARSHAGDPDQGLPWNSDLHWYNPDLLVGGAPGMAQESYDYARSYYLLQNYNDASIWIARSSHYLTDVGNPFHTGMEIHQILINQTVHERYESWVASRWTTSNYNFGDYTQGYYYDYLWSGNPSDSTKSVAQVSHPYLETLWTKFSTYTDQQLENDASIRDITRLCISNSSRYTNGLVDNWVLTKFPGYANYPKDNDADNRYEDINGNNRPDYDDVVAYFYEIDWVRSTQPFRLFDYTRNGAITFNDITWLYDLVLAS